MISQALLNAPFFIPKDADLLRNRKVNTKKRQNRHLPELAFLILGTYFTAPFFIVSKSTHFRTKIICIRFRKASSKSIAAPIYDEKIRERIRYIFDMIMKDDEKGKEQNAQGLYENRVINEISVNSQEVFYQDAYDRCVKEVSYNTQNKMYNIMHKRMRLYIIIQQKRPETGFFC